MKRRIVYSALAGCLLSCQWFGEEQKKEAVARVGDTYLYKSDVAGIFSYNMAVEDSIQLLRTFINNWAKKQLLIEKAMVNLNKRKLAELETFIQNYRADLYMNAYQEALVSKRLDTVISAHEIVAFYNENKDNFRLSEELVKLRYIYLNKNNSAVNKITERFRRFNNKDRKMLDSLTIQFKRHSFNDSIWVKMTQVLKKIPLITASGKENYLKKSQFFDVSDSLGVYLIYVKDVARIYDAAPLDYVKPTVRQIILNQRKVALIRDLERDIINDAIRKKQFEVYESP